MEETMEHPLIGSLDKLTQEQVSEKINELNKKLAIATRFGNGHLCQQLRMAIESYQIRNQQILQEQIKKDSENSTLHLDKIDIS
jgi:hypothetical protein